MFMRRTMFPMDGCSVCLSFAAGPCRAHPLGDESVAGQVTMKSLRVLLMCCGWNKFNKAYSGLYTGATVRFINTNPWSKTLSFSLLMAVAELQTLSSERQSSDLIPRSYHARQENKPSRRHVFRLGERKKERKKHKQTHKRGTLKTKAVKTQTQLSTTTLNCTSQFSSQLDWNRSPHQLRLVSFPPSLYQEKRHTDTTTHRLRLLSYSFWCLLLLQQPSWQISPDKNLMKNVKSSQKVHTV